MRTTKSLLALLFLLLILNGWRHAANTDQVPEPSPEGLEFFEKKIRPVLAANCYVCHSAQANKPQGGLLLDSREGLLKGGSSGLTAVVPGDPEKSRLIHAIRYSDPKLQMPPLGKLADDQIKDFEAWIKMGAPVTRKAGPVDSASTYDFDEARNFWSFKPVKSVTAPTVKQQNWLRNEIDRFILAKLEEKGLSPSRDADRRTLIRRASFDLIGMPPTPDEVDAFVDDKSANAFEKVIERLLASPHYGERWGRHWLDVVRYADTSGCNSDFPIPSAYKYRNYVIKAFNDDKPYDQFVREQIAGDLLPAANDARKHEQIVATGYLAISRRFGSRNNEFHLTIDDTIDNVGKAVLGLSISCARCHDHKFDPIPTSDYYALYGFFESTRYAFPGTEIYRHTNDFIPLTPAHQAARLIKWQNELAHLDDRVENLGIEKGSLERKAKIAKAAGEKDSKPPEPTSDKPARTVEQVVAELKEVKARIAELEAQQPNIEKAYGVSEGKAVNAKIFKKGDPRSKGDEVRRGFLQVLGGQTLPENEKGSGRLQLAEWLTEARNPLTARVMVNRIWQYHFGKGLVQTSNDFGIRGKSPTHPELLDYLAAKFIDNDWSIKAMHRFIMLSHAYQMSSGDDLAKASIDFANDLLWRFNRRRLAAEEIRDSLLVISDSLDRTMASEHPFPPEKDWRYTQHNQFFADYETDRRSVYLMQQRLKKQRFFEVFDGADTNSTTAGRSSTTTPIQALFMMNDPFVHKHADLFAVRIGLAYSDTARRIDYAYRLALGRHATKEEIRTAEEYLTQVSQDLHETDIPADRRTRAALASFCRVLISGNEFLFLE
jgi:hypothetical protein